MPYSPLEILRHMLDETTFLTEAREGMDSNEIEPVPREVRVVQRGPLRIAVPVEEGPPLAEETVQRVRREIREHGG